MTRGFRVKAPSGGRLLRRGVIPVIVGASALVVAPAAFAVCADPGTTYSRVDKDSYVAQGNPTANFGTNDYMRVGHNQTNEKWHAYVHFPLPDIPPGCTVIGGSIGFFSGFAPSQSGVGDVWVNRVESNWNETNPNGLNWNNKPAAVGTPDISFPTIAFTGIDGSGAIIGFYNGQPNTGVVIRPDPDDSAWDPGEYWYLETRELRAGWAFVNYQ